MEQSVEKELKIKTSVVLRTVKDLEYYLKESELLKAKYRESNEEQRGSLRQLQDVIAETELMIPDAQLRLQRAVGELEESLEKANDAGLSGTESVERARSCLHDLRDRLTEV